jgi:sporulation protein YlmC with PRC-barrel domain
MQQDMRTSSAGGVGTRRSSDTARMTDSSLIDSKRVEGAAVYDFSGKHIGTIKRLVLDKQSGRVVYTVAHFGGFLGLGGNEYAIPWTKLSYDTRLKGYVTGITEEQLKNSPDYGRNANEDDWFDRDQERAIYDYYETDYYWSP